MVKGIIFDIDGTLLDSFESNLDFFQTLMRKSGHHPPTAEEYRPLFHLKLKDALKKMLPEAGNAEVEKIYTLAHKNDWETKLANITEGVEEVIEMLSKNYNLAIVTNRIKQFVFEPPMDRLKSYFNIVIAQEDTVTHKPSPEPLLLAAERLDLSPNECVYVGDVENDAIAAHAAGMLFILYSKVSIPGIKTETSNFRSIPVLLKTL